MTFLSGVIVASGVVLATHGANRPSCPQEDSCVVTTDYSHGKWTMTVTEVTP